MEVPLGCSRCSQKEQVFRVRKDVVNPFIYLIHNFVFGFFGAKIWASVYGYGMKSAPDTRTVGGRNGEDHRLETKEGSDHYWLAFIKCML